MCSIFYVLSSSTLCSRYLDSCLERESIRPQDVRTVLAVVASNPTGRLLAWRHLRAHWVPLQNMFGEGSFTMGSLITAVVAHFSSEFDYAEVIHSVFSLHPWILLFSGVLKTEIVQCPCYGYSTPQRSQRMRDAAVVWNRMECCLYLQHALRFQCTTEIYLFNSIEFPLSKLNNNKCIQSEETTVYAVKLVCMRGTLC